MSAVFYFPLVIMEKLNSSFNFIEVQNFNVTFSVGFEVSEAGLPVNNMKLVCCYPKFTITKKVCKHADALYLLELHVVHLHTEDMHYAGGNTPSFLLTILLESKMKQEMCQIFLRFYSF